MDRDDVFKMEFFATVGRGLEPFLKDYLYVEKKADKVIIYDGKIGFSIDPSTSTRPSLCSLPFTERLFFKLGILQYSDLNVLTSEQKSDEFLIEKWLFETLAHGLKPAHEQWRKQSFENNCIDRSPSNTKRSKPTVTFRVNFRSSTELMPMERCKKRICSLVAKQFRDQLGWSTDLRRPHVEIYVHAGVSHLFLGLPVSSKSLSNRSYVLHSGLRNTICDAMISLANVQPGDILLDPMCGKGTLLVHALHSCPTLAVIGNDQDSSALRFVAENMEHLSNTVNRSVNFATMHSDATKLPIRDNCIDVIVCDLPFGYQSGSIANAEAVYPTVVSECFRLLRPGGRCVLLTSTLLFDGLRVDCKLSRFDVTSEHKLDLGRTTGAMLAMNKPNTPT